MRCGQPLEFLSTYVPSHWIANLLVCVHMSQDRYKTYSFSNDAVKNIDCIFYIASNKSASLNLKTFQASDN